MVNHTALGDHIDNKIKLNNYDDITTSSNLINKTNSKRSKPNQVSDLRQGLNFENQLLGSSNGTVNATSTLPNISINIKKIVPTPGTNIDLEDDIQNQNITNLRLSHDNECEIRSKHEPEDGPFVWSKSMQGILLGAVYWGYMIIQIPASFVVNHYGSKKVGIVSMTIMAILTMLIHPMSYLSPWAVFCLRVAVGLCTVRT